MNRKIVVACLALVCAVMLSPAEAAMTSLAIDATGAREAAMAGASTAVADSSSASLSNPAGLSQLIRREFFISLHRYPDNTLDSSLNVSGSRKFAFPNMILFIPQKHFIDDFNLAVGYQKKYREKREYSNTIFGSFSQESDIDSFFVSSSVYLGGISNSYNSFMLGLTLENVHTSITSDSDNFEPVDSKDTAVPTLGLLYKINKRDFRASLVYHEKVSDVLPARIVGGVSKRFSLDRFRSHTAKAEEGLQGEQQSSRDENTGGSAHYENDGPARKRPPDKYLTIAFDYERRFHSSIDSTLDNTDVFEFGMEMALDAPGLHNFFMLRAGYRHLQNPFSSQSNFFLGTESRNTFCFGIGYQTKNYSVDLAFEDVDDENMSNFSISTRWFL